MSAFLYTNVCEGRVGMETVQWKFRNVDELKQKALHDENLRQELLATKEDSQPLTGFLAENVRTNGYPIL